MNDIGLEKYYKGDVHWKSFVELYNSDCEESDIKTQLALELNHNIDIAKVIFGVFGRQSLVWIEKEIPALNNLKPKDCVFDDNLIKRLKTLLIRMPK